MKRWIHLAGPTAIAVAFLGLWSLASHFRLMNPSIFPAPSEVYAAFLNEAGSGRLVNDLIVSLFRVLSGFLLAVSLGVPFGLCLGLSLGARATLLPTVNFFRNLSPLAWMPFAVVWFGVGDAPAIFLVFLSAFFSVCVATLAAVANVSSVYMRVAREYGMGIWSRVWEVMLPAILPQVITTMRVAAGICWTVVVAAEMIAGRDGLGFAVMDSRNGLRTDILVVEMIVIGLVGICLDRVLFQLTKIPSIRWGYER